MSLTKVTFSMISGAPINVQDYGASPSASAATNVAALQAALTDLVISKGVLTIPAGIYTINAKLALTSAEGFAIEAAGAVIKAEDAMTVGSGTQLLHLTGCTDFSITGLVFDGNRANRLPIETTSHLLEFTDCQRFTLKDVKADNATTDGMYFNASNAADSATFCRDFVLENCGADNAYRNGVSVINGLDFSFIGGAFTNANGAAPMAGVDVESNAGAANPSNRSIKFNGTRFEGNAGYGLQLSSEQVPDHAVVSGCYFADNDLGGVITGLHLSVDNCLFENFTAAGAYGVKISAISTALAVVTNSIFRDFTTGVGCIDDGSASQGMTVSGCYFENTSSAFSPSGVYCYASNNTIINASDVSISISTGCTATIVNNYIEAATKRGIFSSADNGIITGNRVVDVASVVGAYIQIDGAGSVITHNYCSATVAAATTVGIRASHTSKEIAFNTCTNLHTTEPYSIQDTQSATSAFIGYNTGGTTNAPRTAKFSLAAPTYTTGGRPAATIVPISATIYDTTLSKPLWSDGTVWRDAAGTAV